MRHHGKLRIIGLTGLMALTAPFVTGAMGHAEPIARSQSLDLNYLPMSFQPEADLLNVALGFSRRYEDVATVGGAAIDAQVTLVAISGLTSNVLDTFDEYDNGPNLSAHTKPSGTAEASAKFRIDFLADNTNSPVVVDHVSLSIADIDTWEFASFTGITGYQLATGTQLTATTTSGVTRFQSSASGTSNTDELRIAQANYDSASSVSVSFGCRANAVSTGSPTGIGPGGRCGFTIPIGNFNWTGTTSATAVSRPSQTVTYDANLGTGTPPSPVSGTGAITISGNTGSLANGANVFVEWNTAANGTGLSFVPGGSVIPLENMTLYAQYLPLHTVTYMGNGGSGSMSNQTSATAQLLTANTHTYSGYTFAGWNTDINGNGVSYADGVSYLFAADLVLYAQWTPISVTTVPSPTTVPAVATTSPATPTTVPSVSVASAQPRTVMYRSNGGTGVMANQISSSTAQLRSNSFLRTGSSFAGWNTKADGSGTAFANAKSYAFTSDMTLYAQWTPVNAATETGGNNLPHTGMTIPLQSVACFLFAGILMMTLSRSKRFKSF